MFVFRSLTSFLCPLQGVKILKVLGDDHVLIIVGGVHFNLLIVVSMNPILMCNTK